MITSSVLILRARKNNESLERRVMDKVRDVIEKRKMLTQ